MDGQEYITAGTDCLIDNMSMRIGFIGAGKMATAMMEGIIAKGLCAKDDIIACCRTESTKKRVEEGIGVECFLDAKPVFEGSDVIIIAVKPNQGKDVLVTNIEAITTKKLIISVAAGVKISTLEKYVPDCKFVRVMPNVCSTVLEGASSFTLGTNATREDATIVESILNAIGMSFEISEDKIDAVTGLSGSSPAYMFMVIDALADGGVLMGLPRDLALRLAAQTMLGSAKTYLETGLHPDVLKDSVCSPGGTTIEGVKVLEESNLRAALINAVKASAVKSKEMSKD